MFILMLTGCGTARHDRHTRAATEMLLVSQAADNAVAQIDFSPLTNKTVFLDASGVSEKDVDKGYLVSLVRQQIAGAGGLLPDEQPAATSSSICEPAAWAADRHSMLLGTPAVQLPSVLRAYRRASRRLP